MLSNIVQDYKNNIEKSNCNVRLVYNNESNKDSFIVEADRERVTQVISNLLNNAIKFTEETRGDVYVATEEMEKADQKVVVVTIKDTGIGIEASKIEKIFDRFYQIDSSHTRDYEGTGIGLSLTKELISLYEGKIWAESQPGKGSCFFVELL